MEPLGIMASFEGRLTIVSRVTNGEHEEQGGYLYFHNIARAAVYWWLCDETDEAKLSDKVLVVCDIAEPAEPSEEPVAGVGDEASVTFPVTISALSAALTPEDVIAEARRLVARKVAGGAEDFEGLQDFHVEIDVAPVSDACAEAA